MSVLTRLSEASLNGQRAQLSACRSICSASPLQQRVEVVTVNEKRRQPFRDMFDVTICQSVFDEHDGVGLDAGCPTVCGPTGDRQATTMLRCRVVGAGARLPSSPACQSVVCPWFTLRCFVTWSMSRYRGRPAVLADAGISTSAVVRIGERARRAQPLPCLRRIVRAACVAERRILSSHKRWNSCRNSCQRSFGTEASSLK